MLSFGDLSHFPWSWVPGALGREGWGVSLGASRGAKTFSSHHPHLHPGRDWGEADVLPGLGTSVWEAESERLGCPTAPIQHLPLPSSPREETFLGGGAAPREVGMVWVQV